MNTLKIRNIELGADMPKICVPIVGTTKEEIYEEATNINESPADLVEWRVDHFENVSDIDDVIKVLTKLRSILDEKPILFTFRTKKEGGAKEISDDDYKKLNVEVAKTKLADLVDVEIFTGDEIVKEIIDKVHEYNVKIVASNHDFFKTPSKEEIISRLVKMQEMGADIPKIAVMPNNKSDVLTLLQATENMNSLYATRPIITMSMGKEGLISRLSGQVFGSALTFASLSKASAPGQIGIDKLKKILELIYEVSQ